MVLRRRCRRLERVTLLYLLQKKNYGRIGIQGQPTFEDDGCHE